MKNRTKIIAGSLAALLVIGGAGGTAYAVNSANNLKHHEELTAQIAQSNGVITTAQTHLPQAAYLWVDGHKVTEESHLAQLKVIAAASDSLLAADQKKSVTELIATLEEERFSEEAKLAPTKEDLTLADQIAEQLENSDATFAPSKSGKGKAVQSPKVTKESLEALRAEAEKLQADAEAEQAKVDAYEQKLDELEQHIVNDAAALVDPAENALELDDKFIKASEKAGKEPKTKFDAAKKALEDALAVYNGEEVAESSEPDAEGSKPEDDTEAEQEEELPTAAERLDFKHTVEDYEPSLEASQALVAALADYVTAGKALKADHDKVAKAEAEKAAAESGASEYVDPGTGQTVTVDPGYYNPGGGSGGGGYTPNPGGGGYVPPVTQNPGGGGGTPAPNPVPNPNPGGGGNPDLPWGPPPGDGGPPNPGVVPRGCPDGYYEVSWSLSGSICEKVWW